ncbi:MAG TPA: 6-bladed beta-propeller, partial [Longimicrobium sp.]|nr:6-bladed beta-propeller [Longimicrobium sp.]
NAADESVPVIHNTERGAWKPGEEWNLVEVARIGSADDDGAAAFGNVVDFALDELGRVWVADALRPELRVFDGRGTLVRTVGRRGAGPGELALVAGMDWDARGRLWVLDAGNARFAVYDTSGAALATHRRTATTTVVPWPGGFDAEGRLYDTGSILGTGGALAEVVVRTDTALERADTFRLPRFQPKMFETARSDARRREVAQVNVPFTGTQVWRVDRDGGVWVAETERYRLERFDFGGRKTRAVERESEPLSVTREERDRMLEGYLAFERKGGHVDASKIPRSHPALNSFFFAGGYLWAQPSYRAGTLPSLDVFEPDGRYLGRIQAPVRILAEPAPVVRGDRMAALTRDANDVPVIVLLEIRKSLTR